MDQLHGQAERLAAKNPELITGSIDK